MIHPLYYLSIILLKPYRFRCPVNITANDDQFYILFCILHSSWSTIIIIIGLGYNEINASGHMFNSFRLAVADFTGTIVTLVISINIYNIYVN